MGPLEGTWKPHFNFPSGVKGKDVDPAEESHCVPRSQEKGDSQDEYPGQKAPLTAGKEAQASLLGAKMVKLPGPSISGLSFSVRSVYSCVVVDPTTPMVS